MIDTKFKVIRLTCVHFEKKMDPAAKKDVNMLMVNKNYDVTIFNNMDIVQMRTVIVYINN